MRQVGCVTPRQHWHTVGAAEWLLAASFLRPACDDLPRCTAAQFQTRHCRQSSNPQKTWNGGWHRTLSGNKQVFQGPHKTECVTQIRTGQWSSLCAICNPWRAQLYMTVHVSVDWTGQLSLATETCSMRWAKCIPGQFICAARAHPLDLLHGRCAHHAMLNTSCDLK